MRALRITSRLPDQGDLAGRFPQLSRSTTRTLSGDALERFEQKGREPPGAAIGLHGAPLALGPTAGIGYRLIAANKGRDSSRLP